MEKTGIMCIGLTDTEFTVKNFDKGMNSLSVVSKKIEKVDAHAIHCYIAENAKSVSEYEKVFDNVKKIKPDIYSLLTYAKDDFKDCDNVLIVHTNEPLLDFSLTGKLLKTHVDNIADYTMSENYPAGISPAVISYDTLKKLFMISSGNNEPYSKNSIFKIINMDINSYDIEVKLAPYDMRRDRLDLFADTKRNFLICNNVFNGLDNIHSDFEKIYGLILEKPEVMRTLPAYIEIEITGNCDLNCVMCPRKRSGRTKTQMSFKDFKTIIKDIHKTCNDAVVCLSGMGEPFLHPDILKMIDFVINKTPLKLVIETSGKDFNKDVADKVLKLYNPCLHIIFSIEAVNATDYEEIRGKDIFNFVENNIDYYISRQTENTFLQFVKMTNNEDKLDDFYERWPKYQDRIIIVKYNDFRHELPMDDSHDLNPVKRFPCWHLKRDMYIHSNAQVVLCKQDYRGERVFGNVLEKGIFACFKGIEDFYISDYKTGPDDYCVDCGEYYTYNF